MIARNIDSSLTVVPAPCTSRDELHYVLVCYQCATYNQRSSTKKLGENDDEILLNGVKKLNGQILKNIQVSI